MAGTIIHARNLDYNIPLKNLTASITFTRGNGCVQGRLLDARVALSREVVPAPPSVAYYGTAFVGYMGLLTGMRPGGWSVSVDERDQNGTVFEVSPQRCVSVCLYPPPLPLQNFLEDVIVAAQGGHLVRRGRQVGLFRSAKERSAADRRRSASCSVTPSTNSRPSTPRWPTSLRRRRSCACA